MRIVKSLISGFLSVICLLSIQMFVWILIHWSFLCVFCLVRLVLLFLSCLDMLFCKGIARKSLNPFNIKYDKNNNWVGQIGQYKGFVQFSSQGCGIRAGVKLLYRYVFDYKLLDIIDIVSKYCPRSVDGNSSTFDDYVNYVTKQLGVMDITTYQGFAKLCQSIAFYECQIQIPTSQIYFMFDILNLSFTNKKF